MRRKHARNTFDRICPARPKVKEEVPELSECERCKRITERVWARLGFKRKEKAPLTANSDY